MGNHNSKVAFSGHGAYGFRVAGPGGLERLLVEAEPDWPLFTVDVVVAEGEPVAESVDGESALLRLRTGGQVAIERGPGRVVYTVPAPLSPDEVAHPFLAPVAAVVAHWHGRESIHAGGFLVGDAVWGVVGDRLGGKSSLLAALAQRGVPVLVDDMLVLDGGVAFAGPRSIDLREDAAAHLGIGLDIGVAGARPRWRVRLDGVDPRARLAGWVFLDWAPGIEVVRLPASETLQRLLRNRGIRLAPPDPSAFVDLSALPAWELRRPRSWDALDATVERLLAAVV
jgi:hypothetical protein